MTASVLLVDPKFPHNVGAALRACALLGATDLFWTGARVPAPDRWPVGARLPREERMRCYERTAIHSLGVTGYAPARPVDAITAMLRGLNGLLLDQPIVPVCVEIVKDAEDLRTFVHPPRALYVFGPEDGSVPKGIRQTCHRFVRIPTALDGDDARTPYNLSHAVALVLYSRLATLP